MVGTFLHVVYNLIFFITASTLFPSGSITENKYLFLKTLIAWFLVTQKARFSLVHLRSTHQTISLFNISTRKIVDLYGEKNLFETSPLGDLLVVGRYLIYLMTQNKNILVYFERILCGQKELSLNTHFRFSGSFIKKYHKIILYKFFIS